MTGAVRSARLSRSDRRAQLLQAAGSVFVAQGYHASAMDDIADAAGVSKPVLYQHFPSKLELYLALLHLSANDLVDRVSHALQITDDNRDRVHGAISAYFGFMAENSQAYRLVFESDLRGEPEVAQVVDRASERCIEALSQVIVADTGVDEANGRLLASGLVGLSQSSAGYWVSQGQPIAQSDAVDLLTRLAWRGISRFPLQPAGDPQ